MFRVNFSRSDWLNSSPKMPDSWQEDQLSAKNRARVDPAIVNRLKQNLFADIFNCVSVPPFLRGLLALVWSNPARQICELAYHFDLAVQQSGFCPAARMFALEMFTGLRLLGFEKIPTDGPLPAGLTRWSGWPRRRYNSGWRRRSSRQRN